MLLWNGVVFAFLALVGVSIFTAAEALQFQYRVPGSPGSYDNYYYAPYYAPRGSSTGFYYSAPTPYRPYAYSDRYPYYYNAPYDAADAYNAARDFYLYR